jgi:molecular chaperone GrpE
MNKPRNHQDVPKAANDTDPEMPEPFDETIEGGPRDEIIREAAQIAALYEEIAELKDRYLRAVAETENVRRRAERERAEAAQFAFARFARDLLNVVDNFSRASDALKPETRDGLPPEAKAVIEGIEATQRELLNIFARYGIKRIEAKGQRFNPNLHQAIAEIPSSEPPGTVIEVVQTGYVIGERLLRPAMVAVAAQSGAKNGTEPRPPGSSIDTST